MSKLFNILAHIFVFKNNKRPFLMRSFETGKEVSFCLSKAHGPPNRQYLHMVIHLLRQWELQRLCCYLKKTNCSSLFFATFHIQLCQGNSLLKQRAGKPRNFIFEIWQQFETIYISYIYLIFQFKKRSFSNFLKRI